ncbi:sugar phosphate isomerase/epimerase [Psychromarinibacter sp. C21-152]|uniref:Sugar phosphate isomerase/epimerase n=1 Tax=Psychromarinibacter sediminicola TaxID=3033385 RepID=A0AAE3NSK3_9RHOB|nr:sugar phosphate isomerase/epimerase [Psychromarinibacter sediminicola]MDF0601671.1 sugar phosphate isomerase/epimerase [Psychromarinibacter sediminicola]
MDFSYQLYSSRNFPPLSDTLRMLAEAGYAQVEGFGGVYDDPDALSGGLQENGLTMPTGHIGLDMLESDPDRVLLLARTLGFEAVFVPFLMPDQRPEDAAGYADFGRRLVAAGKPVTDAGLKFGWHNHDFEFRPLADGTRPIEAMTAAAPELLLELDLAWVHRAGEDPVAWIDRYADRILSVHIKDIAPAGENEDEDGWADVGHGVMDWPAINAALEKTDVAYRVMEHDKPSDDTRFARRSIATAKSW